MGAEALLSATTPMLERMFIENQIVYELLIPGVIQSEEHLFAVKIPVRQLALSERFGRSRSFTPREVLPALGVFNDWKNHIDQI